METADGQESSMPSKKRYKYLLIKEIIAYHDTPQFLKDQLSLAVERVKWGAAGMAHGRPLHFLDAANLVKIAWNEISSQSLKNCFKKADIISSFRDLSVVEVIQKFDETIDEIVNLLQNTLLLHPSDDSEICREVETCFDDDNNDSEFFKSSLLEEIEDAMKTALVVGVSDDVLDDSEPKNDPSEVIVEADQREIIHGAFHSKLLLMSLRR